MIGRQWWEPTVGAKQWACSSSSDKGNARYRTKHSFVLHVIRALAVQVVQLNLRIASIRFIRGATHPVAWSHCEHLLNMVFLYNLIGHWQKGIKCTLTKDAPLWFWLGTDQITGFFPDIMLLYEFAGIFIWQERSRIMHHLRIGSIRYLLDPCADRQQGPYGRFWTLLGHV